ncbi:MAG: hypothetical protein KTR31_00560 [Myxococcales bacterium]|nr:hypothetical protein [Myxococcales bacterium]
MPLIDLRNHIVSATGTWCNEAELAAQTPFSFTLADTHAPHRLMLRWPSDAVTIAGPVRLQISFQTENVTFAHAPGTAQLAMPQPTQAELVLEDAAAASVDVAGTSTAGIAINPNAAGATLALHNAATLQSSTVYSYTLDVPAGQVWPFAYDTRANTELGANHVDRVLIEVAGAHTQLEPVAAGCDLPCDWAVADRPDAASFFPVGCEPCDPAAVLRMPPMGTALSVPAAAGGCVRTRFFNGMFISREDLQTEQRYLRTKSRLHNRTLGQGVVWGLNVGLQAEQVCVLPGYALDCCGNDLTVTSVYKVDVASLLADPAAAPILSLGTGTEQRLHLLLEYVECPTDPRPVHADPCGPTQAVCEPSRIRETVRLRLVPPRHPDASGSLRDFLLTAEALHAKYGETVVAPADVPGLANVVLVVGGGATSVEVAPGQSTTVVANPLVIRPSAIDGVLTGGTMTVTDTTAGDVLFEGPMADFAVPGSAALTLPAGVESVQVTLSGWRAESPLAPFPRTQVTTGTATYSINRDPTGAEGYVVSGDEEEAARAEEVVRQGVCDTTCSPPTTSAAGAPAGPAADAGARGVWLHADPLSDAHAGDPKAAVLGIVGAWLQHSAAKASTAEGSSLSQIAASAIYRAAWLLLYGVDATDDRADVTQALQALLRGWCGEALYPGPTCSGTPHGVVIGCARVAGGAIQHIDPFAGRRNVITAPILMHGGARLGVAPVDATVNRLLSLLCCTAALPMPSTGTDEMGLVLEVLTDDAGNQVFLSLGTEAGVARAFVEEQGSAPASAAVHHVSLLQMAQLVIDAWDGAVPAATGEATVDRYTLNTTVQTGVLSLWVLRSSGLRGRLG